MSQLHSLGFTNVRYYRGGLEDWRSGGGRLESERHPLESAGGFSAVPERVLRAVTAIPVVGWIAGWLAMVVVLALVYCLLGGVEHQGVLLGGERLSLSLGGFFDGLYFSGVTATTLGYGDATPLGVARGLAVLEAALGMLFFGGLVTKLLSTRQEYLVGELHRMAFEDRLGRVQTGLHLVLASLQGIEEPENDVDQRVLNTRLESSLSLFAMELRTVHELLYRRHNPPPEEILEPILINIDSALQETHNLVNLMCASQPCVAEPPMSLGQVCSLAQDICAACVPHRWPESINKRMDAIQTRALDIGARFTAAT